MTKAKLLLVNLQNPGDTRYQNPKTAGSYLLGRRLSNYAVFVVQAGKLNQIDLASGDCFVIQNQIDKAMQLSHLKLSTTNENPHDHL